MKRAPGQYTALNDNERISVAALFRLTASSMRSLLRHRPRNGRVALLLLCAIYFIVTVGQDEESSE